jgi:hypothetical protein
MVNLEVPVSQVAHKELGPVAPPPSLVAGHAA